MHARRVLTAFTVARLTVAGLTVAGLTATALVGGPARAATVISTSRVGVALELRDQIDGLNEVAVSVTCAPVNIQPPTDTETIRLIPDVPTGSLTFPGFTSTTLCGVSVTVDSAPAIGGLAVSVNGTVVGGPVVSQLLQVAGVVPGAAPQVRIIISKAPLPTTTVTTSTTGTSGPTTTAASAATSSTSTVGSSTTVAFVIIPNSDRSASATVPQVSAATTTSVQSPSTSTVPVVQAGNAPVVARVLERPKAVVITPARPTTTTRPPTTTTRPSTTTRAPVHAATSRSVSSKAGSTAKRKAPKKATKKS